MAGATTKRKRARWGDTAAKRSHILGAAQQLIERPAGYLGFSMRATADRAGIGLSSLYFYFRTKEEIFLTLYSVRLEALERDLNTACDRAETFEELVAGIADSYLDFYLAYGQYLNLWQLLAGSSALRDLPPELVRTLQTQVAAIFRSAGSAMGRLTDVVFDPRALFLFWVTLNGLATNYSGPRSHVMSYGWREMVVFAAKTLLAGLREGAR